jgi:hypothetical protein
MASVAADASERHLAELMRLRGEVERLRAARLDASAAAAEAAATAATDAAADAKGGGSDDGKTLDGVGSPPRARHPETDDVASAALSTPVTSPAIRRLRVSLDGPCSPSFTLGVAAAREAAEREAAALRREAEVWRCRLTLSSPS